MNLAHKVATFYLEQNDLYNAYKYNNVEQLFYEKMSHESYGGKTTEYMNRVLYHCIYQRISILEKKQSYNEALDLAFNLLRTYESHGLQTERTAKLEEEIGYIYYLFGNYEKALSFYLKAIDVIKTTNDLFKIGSVYNDLYGIYSAMGDKNTAIKYCFSALNCFKKVNHREGVRVAYGNLTMYYQDLNVDKALAYELQSLEMRGDSVDFDNPGLDELTLGKLYQKKAAIEKNPTKKKEFIALSEKSFGKACRIGKWLNDKSILKDYMEGMALLEKEMNNPEKAFEYMRQFAMYKDSLISEQNNTASINSLLKYEFNKKEREQQLLVEKREALKQKEFEKQKILKNVFIGGFIFAALFGLFVFGGFKNKQKAHRIISTQKNEVERQKKMVEDKQSQLLHSINYAQRIQNNLLKSENDLRDILPESFIIFKPRDIVSGDFYWFTKTGSDEIIIILGDCTGHGVPGALLSMIGITAINEIVNHQQITDPGIILQRLSTDIHDAFSKDQNLVKTDGMDLSVCRIIPSEKKLFFAGVNQCLFICEKNGVIKAEPQVNSVNGIFDIQSDQNINVQKFDIAEGNSFYLFSDGVIDQIGESTGKKYLVKRLQDLICAQAPGKMKDQKESILKEMSDWQGNYRQIDDICMIGFKI
jgi:serine phosphatase RsbU (regulator of sigma subunit)